MSIVFPGWRWAARGGLLVVLFGVAGWLGHMVQETRLEREQLTQTLTGLPERLSAEAVQQTALSQHRPVLEKLQRWLPGQQEVGAVASALEQAGGRHQVTVTLTGVTKAEERDASGAIIPPSGPVRDIQITGTVSGAPGRLLDWLGAVERLPYLLRVDAWKLQVVTAAAGQATTQVLVPAPSVLPAVLPAELSFSLLLSVHYAD